jgi:hypothetical protein
MACGKPLNSVQSFTYFLSGLYRKEERIIFFIFKILKLVMREADEEIFFNISRNLNFLCSRKALVFVLEISSFFKKIKKYYAYQVLTLLNAFICANKFNITTEYSELCFQYVQKKHWNRIM